MRLLRWILPLAVAILGCTRAEEKASPETAQAPAPAAPTLAIPQVGQPAPDFTLKYLRDPQDPKSLDSLSLSSFKGKENVLLAFYVADFSPG